ncbi:MAG: lysostaphin resistance A-like protein [Chitinophagales bacterium]
MAGISYGLLSSFLLVFLLRRKFLSNTKNFFSRLISKFRVNYFDVFFLSFCAGVGEEIFFRAAIQPWLGIWLTSLLFIGLHGYLNLKDKPLFIYGVVLFFVSLGFGFLMEYAGLWSAMIAHFLIDVLLLSELKKKSLLQGT